MNMFKKYLEYMKDNPENLWFKRKLYGWGWTPVKWQGWAVIGLFFVTVIFIGRDFGNSSPEPTSADLAWFFAKIVAAIAVLFVICYLTGEKPKWQWGFPKDDSK